MSLEELRSGSNPNLSGVLPDKVTQVFCEALSYFIPQKSVEWTYKCPFPPSIQQSKFLALNCIEAFYGGAAGGGKSDCLLQSAAQGVDDPNYRAIIFRRNYALLEQAGGLIPRSWDYFGDCGAKWQEKNHRWIFPSGAQIAFGHMENEKDYYRYKGGQYQFIGFDELTEFTREQYIYLFSRLRKKEGSNLSLRMRSASNPDGIGYEWVKQRFIVEGEKNGILFIPAKLTDNPHIDQLAYIASLDRLDPVSRARLLEGNWGIRPPGAMFRREWFNGCIKEESPPLQEVSARVRFWDLAATEETTGKDPDYTAGVLMGKLKNKRFVVFHCIKQRGTPLKIKQLIKQTALIDGYSVKIVIEQEGGASGIWVVDDLVRELAGYRVSGKPSRRNKIERAGPFSSQCERGNVDLVQGPWVTDWLDSHEAFPTPGIHDDDVDATSGAFGELVGGLIGGYPKELIKFAKKPDLTFRKDTEM